jgi:hypothetical protein
MVITPLPVMEAEKVIPVVPPLSPIELLSLNLKYPAGLDELYGV